MVLMSRRFLAIAAVLAASLPAAAAPSAAMAAEAAEQGEQRCANQESRRRRGGMLGGIGGGLLRQALPGRAGGLANFIPTEQILSEAITAMLDCREREQAVNATNEAVRGGVGTTTTWQSETRPGVSGSSVVTAQTREANGGDCMTVTDIIIVNGEETRAPKTLCKRPPSQRYVRV